MGILRRREEAMRTGELAQRAYIHPNAPGHDRGHISAAERDTVRPVRDQLQPALTRWPLRAVLELGALPTAPACARAWIRQILYEWRLSGLTDSCELTVSELVTNAVLASRELGQSAIWLSLVSDREQLMILVRDFHSAAPTPRHARDDEEGGRGLMLVEAISDRFGWYRPEDEPAGKVVWAVLSG